MFDFLKIIFAQLFILIIWFGCTPVNKSLPEEEGFEHIFRCGAEEVDDDTYSFFESSGDSIRFGNVDARTYETSFSGTFALKLTPEKPYGFTTEYTIGPDEYFQVTVWRKSSGNNGAIVIDGGEGFYTAGKDVVDESDNGWQKISLEVFAPPHIEENHLKIYVWNTGQDTVYFDDFQMVHRNKKVYPEYEFNHSFFIYTDNENLEYFNQKRIEAFQKTVLVNNDEDYAGTVFFDGNDFLNGDIRLKGDLMDHIQGDKWSFRIKLKKGFTWNNIRTFSIQSPATRYFLYEWLSHQIFAQEDVLTTRYGFMPLVVNDEPKGIYAWEEHFEKHLIESNNRREGPIVRFNESLFWQRLIETNKSGFLWDVDYFTGSKITPFKEGSMLSDSLLSRQTEEAHKLVLQYKRQSMPVSEIFDVDILARYYALMDITQAYHGFTWHNQRFYFNPVTCLLEPIAFDGYIEGGIFRRIEEPVIALLDPSKIETFNKEELLLYQVFTDTLFNRKYLDYLKNYSEPSFVENIAEKYSLESDSLANLIRQEFPWYRFSFDLIEDQARFIRENLDAIESNIPKLGQAFSLVNREKFFKEFTTEVNQNITPMLVHAYYNQNRREVDILNYHAGEISVTGALINNNLPENFGSNVVVEAYDGRNPGRAKVRVKGEPDKILFSVSGELLETEVSPWTYTEGMTARQQLKFSGDTASLPWHGDSVIFDGDYLFQKDVYIPPGTPVVFKAGTKINLTKGAGFFSFSAIKSEGEDGNMVEVFSGDKTSQGFHVLQSKKRSEFKYTRFFQLGNIRKGGWQTPSAVTFYEADVDFNHCTFESNVDCDDALNTVRSDFYMENCSFIHTFADAFDSDFCTGLVKNSTFFNIGNDAIDFSGSQVTITGCEMAEVHDKAISGGENSNLKVENCVIGKATIGIASKDLSHLELKNIELTKTVYGFVVFVKKPEYGPASIKVENLKMRQTMVFHQVEEGSVLTVNGKNIYGREKKLAIKLYQ